jgi:hypothetical protein
VADQIVYLLVLALPIASISWTVTHEDVFREPREWCVAQSKTCRAVFARKFFYLFTCEYCFSHWVTAFFLLITRYSLLYNGWRGYLVAEFALVWVANIYMGFFGRLRLEIKEERAEVTVAESKARDAQRESAGQNYQDYSQRNVVAGSIRDARQAGSHAANVPTAMSTMTAPETMAGSRGRTP